MDLYNSSFMMTSILFMETMFVLSCVVVSIGTNHYKFYTKTHLRAMQMYISYLMTVAYITLHRCLPLVNHADLLEGKNDKSQNPQHSCLCKH